MESKLPPISESKVSQYSKLETALDDDDDDDDNQLLKSSPLWHREEDGWEMTWPIWHMLPRDERKALAHKNGYNTIGEFEEYMSLQQTVHDSEIQLQQPYPNKKIYIQPKEAAVPREKQQAEQDEDYDEDDSSSETGKPEYESSCTEDLSLEELIKLGGKILMLHDEILHQVFSWLPVDTYATLAYVSPHWKHLTRTEPVYKRLCERLYLNQSKRRQLHVSRFGGSYRRMLEQRPRVRAAGGCYVLKYREVKKIQRDMWTEVSTPGQSLHYFITSNV